MRFPGDQRIGYCGRVRVKREEDREERCVRLGAGACVGRVVSVEVWQVPKDLGGQRAGGGRRCGRGKG